MLLPAGSGRADHRKIVLSAAGPYTSSDGWLIDTSRMDQDPIPNVADATGRPMRIEKVRGLLSGWGLKKQYHRAWMRRHGFTTFDRNVVRPGKTVREQVIHALSYIGRPASKEKDQRWKR